MRTPAGIAIAVAVGLLAPSVASAHVDVLPTRIVQSQATEFTLRVPNERPPLDTVAVRVAFPTQVTVYALDPPPPGFTMEVRKSADQRIVGVTYRGAIGPERYRDFTFLGTAFERGTTLWRSWQTYSDGKTKPWTTKPLADGSDSGETGPTVAGPGAAVEVLPEGATPAGTTTTVSAAGDDGGSGAGIWLGVIAVALAAGALVGTGLLWSTRPMRLPDDDPGDPDRR